jgi:hypothetical protein
MFKYLFALVVLPSASMAVELDQDFMLFNLMDAMGTCENTGECVELETLSFVLTSHGLCVNEFTGLLQKGLNHNHGTSFCRESK